MIIGKSKPNLVSEPLLIFLPFLMVIRDRVGQFWNILYVAHINPNLKVVDWILPFLYMTNSCWDVLFSHITLIIYILWLLARVKFRSKL